MDTHSCQKPLRWIAAGSWEARYGCLSIYFAQLETAGAAGEDNSLEDSTTWDSHSQRREANYKLCLYNDSLEWQEV